MACFRIALINSRIRYSGVVAMLKPEIATIESSLTVEMEASASTTLADILQLGAEIDLLIKDYFANNMAFAK